MKKKSFLRRVCLVLLALLLVLGIGTAAYANDYYHADAAVQADLVSGDTVTVSQLGEDWVFSPAGTPQTGLIFYPGGKVEYTAYAPLLHKLAERGVLCVLVKMPLNLAVLNANAADGLAAQLPEVEHWYIGGHSLGGAMAASYAASHADELDGLVLLAAYSTADLNGTGLRVFSAYGSMDGVLNRDKYEADRPNLPADTTEWIIEGGCHAGFGAYGAQDGDGTPTISGEEQIAQTTDQLAAWMLS